MILYRADMENKEIGPNLLEFFKHSEESYERIEHLKSIKSADQGFEIQIQ